MDCDMSFKRVPFHLKVFFYFLKKEKRSYLKFLSLICFWVNLLVEIHLSIEHKFILQFTTIDQRLNFILDFDPKGKGKKNTGLNSL